MDLERTVTKGNESDGKGTPFFDVLLNGLVSGEGAIQMGISSTVGCLFGSKGRSGIGIAKEC